jgi:electron transfer flavoprotein alpha subunit
MSMKGILIIIDTIKNKPPASSPELISFAEKLAANDHLPVTIIIAGDNTREAAEKASLYGLDVIGLEHDDFRYPNPDLLANQITSLIDEFHPAYICLQHTMRGCQTAALVSAAAGFRCITAVESFSLTDNSLSFRRSMYNGKINVDLRPDAVQSVVTVLPGAFPIPDMIPQRRSPGKIQMRKTTGKTSYTPTGIRESAEENVRLEESDVIISAGRGIGARENLELIRSVARLFPNSAVGASRTICDLKWLPFAHQVGVTGKTVSPKLYMACGISGAQQHIAGMKGSQIIVAVNKDPQAAIFSISDYIIVEDLTTFLPLLIEKYNSKK